MTTVEQAIYTSATTARSAGYQLVAHSPGLAAADARELAVWCPSHDSLLNWDADSYSYNFHPLPSGAFGVSRSISAGWEYSGRGGVRVYTHCLIVSPETLLRFSNNPFAVLRAAEALGALEPMQSIPAKLAPLSLSGGAPPVDQNAVSALCSAVGPQAAALFVQAAADSVCLAAACTSPVELIAGLFNCLPTSCRTEFPFSTGLKFSPRRPFRIVVVTDDPGERNWISHQNNVAFLDLTGQTPPPALPLDGWAQFIERVLTTGRISFLASQLAKRRFDLSLDDLHALGLQLLEELEATHFTDSGPAATKERTIYEDDSTPDLPVPNENPLDELDQVPPNETLRTINEGDAEIVQHAHAAHRRFARFIAAVDSAERDEETTAGGLDLASHETLERLEVLDDLVYEAIGGDPTAMRKLAEAWPKLKTELSAPLLAESREQYLRYALSIWEGCVDVDGLRHANRAVQALDVLCLLFEE